MDKDGNGCVDQEEFCQHFESSLPQDEDQFQQVIRDFHEAATHITQKKRKALESKWGGMDVIEREVHEAKERIYEAELEVTKSGRDAETADRQRQDYVGATEEAAIEEIKAEERKDRAEEDVAPHEEVWKQLDDHAQAKQVEQQEAVKQVEDITEKAEQKEDLVNELIQQEEDARPTCSRRRRSTGERTTR